MKPSELFDLSGKVAIVTGGGSGIGRQMATGLAEAGADVALCARKPERCEEVARELGQLGIRAFGMRCDVRDPAEVQAVVDRTRAELGRIDVLVNNAGTSWGAPAEDHPLEAWQKVIDVNLTGVFLFAQTVGRAMIEQQGGKIVNIASVAAFGGAPPELMNAVAYNASKAGVVGFTRDLATKWAEHGINVNAIAPGWFPSDMNKALLDAQPDAYLEHIPLKRFGGPDDLKGAVVFLSSRASDFVTGQVVVVDGGQSAW
ncbi:MAG TPA: SDR family oxidoreductase [Gaiellaceae bacterium]|nr:SDR family oxidoreductase [Gaiellaceae bacterium]